MLHMCTVMFLCIVCPQITIERVYCSIWTGPAKGNHIFWQSFLWVLSDCQARDLPLTGEHSLVPKSTDRILCSGQSWYSISVKPVTKVACLGGRNAITLQQDLWPFSQGRRQSAEWLKSKYWPMLHGEAVPTSQAVVCSMMHEHTGILDGNLVTAHTYTEQADDGADTGTSTESTCCIQ